LCSLNTAQGVEGLQRAVGKLALALAWFLRELFERQTGGRMDAGTLTPTQIEALGLALMGLDETIGELAARFGRAPRSSTSISAA
jgi:hypothetical protein